VFAPPAGYQPASAAELVAASAEQLQRLVAEAGADRTLCVHAPAAEGGDAGSEAARAAPGATRADGSMLWAFQAHLAARAGGRLSLVTFGAHAGVPGEEGAARGAARGRPGADAAAAAALALARTHWMEARASAGPALDIWPPDALPAERVAPPSPHQPPHAGGLCATLDAALYRGTCADAVQHMMLCEAGMAVWVQNNAAAGARRQDSGALCRKQSAAACSAALLPRALSSLRPGARGRSCVRCWSGAASTAWQCAAGARTRSAWWRSRRRRRGPRAPPAWRLW